MHDTRRTRAVFGVLLVVAVGLIALDYSDASSSVLREIRVTAGSVFGRIERAVAAIGQHGDGNSGQIAALQRQVLRLRAELSTAQLSQADDAQLRRLLQLAGAGGYRIVAARVIAAGQGYQQMVTLDAGSADGVAPQQTVLDGHGLAGEVVSVSAQTSTVRLATDAGSAIGVRLAPGGEPGFVSGQGAGTSGPPLLKLRMLNAAAPLTAGQQLVTTASVGDRPFVPGVPVGVISKVLRTGSGLIPTALVRPYADFGGLQVVGIVVSPPRRNPRFSVLPPSPSARPAPTVTRTVTARPAPGGAR